MTPRPPPPRTVRAAALGVALACLVAPGAAPADDGVRATAATRATDALVTVAAGPRAALLPGEDLVGLARRLGLAFDGLVAANPGLDPFSPNVPDVVVPARRLVPPGPREGLVVNLPELTLYRFDGRGGVRTYPIGAGRVGDATPTADTRVTAVETNPSWRPPASIRAEHRAAGLALPAVVPPGPDNPLGDHAIRLALPGYLLHGTNVPEGVGMRVSHGCVRLYPEDAARLAREVGPGTRVRIVDEPVKWAFDGDALLLEAHRPFALDGRDGGALLRGRFDALRAELRARGASVAAFDAALGRLHAEGRLFTGLVAELPLER